MKLPPLPARLGVRSSTPADLSAPRASKAPLLDVFEPSESAAVTKSASLPLATQVLRQRYQEIRAQAVKLAGAPGDIPQRAMLHYSIYLDSGGNHPFPQVALHGALWAVGYFKAGGTAGDLLEDALHPFDDAQRAQKKAELHAFEEGFKEANRSVFIDTYTNYFFTKEYGQAPGAKTIIAPALLEVLNRIHAAARDGTPLTPDEKRQAFHQSLLWEQESTVAPKVKAEVAKLDEPLVKALALSPFVHFSYFPETTIFHFNDFSNTDERIKYALESYDIAAQVGWPKVYQSMRSYDLLPAEFFADPAKYVVKLKADLLAK